MNVMITHGRLRFASVLLLGALLFAFAAPDARGQERTVAIGYIKIALPWLGMIADGTFDRETGYKINWVLHDTGAQAIQDLHDGKVQIAFSGSTGIAVGMSADVNMELFWIAADIAYSEALVARNQSKIVTPRDLRGKRIGVPFWSTAHFHLLFALEQFGFKEDDVKIVNLTPGQIVDNWKAGAIDAAFVWYPALEELLPTGTAMLWSGWINRWGKTTFDGLIAHRQWSAANPEFMTKFVGLIEDAKAKYRADPAKWTRGAPEVQAIARALGGGANVPVLLAALNYPDVREQLSSDWLGGGRNGTAAVSLRETARFLERSGRVKKVADDYSAFINPRWAQAVLAEQQKRTSAPTDMLKK